MSLLELVVREALVPSAFIVAIAWLLQKFMERHFARDLQSHQESLRAQTEQELARLSGAVQRQLFEFQTQFGLLHQKRADAIAEIYHLLAVAEGAIVRIVSPLKFNELPDSELFKMAATSYNALLDRFRSLRIYLPPQACDRLERTLQTLHAALGDYMLGADPAWKGKDGLQLRDRAWKKVTEEIPLLKRELEELFRAILEPDSSRSLSVSNSKNDAPAAGT